MKKVLVRFKVANDIVGEGYWDFWLDQGQESSRSILKGNGELEDTGTKMGKIKP